MSALTVADPGARPAAAVPSPGTRVDGITVVADLVVTSDRVFLSDSYGGIVAITDHTGADVGLLTDLPGASGMVARGGVLYVATLGDKVERFDLSTSPPTRLTPWDTSAVGRPWNLAIAGGFLWFTGCDESLLGRVNMTTGSVTDRTPAGLTDSCPALEWSPYAPDVLIVHQRVTEDPVHGYDVSSGVPVELFEEPQDHASALAILPGGDRWVMSSPIQPAVSYALGDLSAPVTTYEPHAATGYPGQGLAVTHRNDDMIAVAYTQAEDGSPDVQIWKVGEEAAFRTFTFSGFTTPYEDAIEFSPNGNRLFVAVPGVVLHVLDPRRKETVLELSLTMPNNGSGDGHVDYGETIRFDVHLVAGVTERTVEIWENPRGTDPPELVRSIEVPDSGDATFSVAADVSTTFWASFAGDDLWEPASTLASEVSVHHVIRGRMLRADGQDGRYAVYRRSSRIYYKAVGAPPHPGETFKIMLERFIDGAWRDYGDARFRQNDRGVVVIYVAAGGLRAGRYSFTSWYGRDGVHFDGYSDPDYFRVR